MEDTQINFQIYLTHIDVFVADGMTSIKGTMPFCMRYKLVEINQQYDGYIKTSQRTIGKTR